MFCMLVAAMLILAACGGGDEDDAGAEAEATSATTTIAVGSPTTEDEDAATPEATTAPANTTVAASPTEDEGAEATAVVDVTATEAAEDAESPTADTAVGSPEGDEALGDIETIDPAALPNYTMTFDFAVNGLLEQEDTEMSLLIEQASPDNYHMVVNTDGSEVEVWRIGEASYISQDGAAPIQVPAGSGQDLFEPSLFLQSLPPFPPEMNVQDEGIEEVNGREARRYTVAGEDYLAVSEIGDVSQLSDIEGGVEILVDEELNILLYFDADITWTNPDGSEGSFIGAQEISNIGDTEEISAP